MATADRRARVRQKLSEQYRLLGNAIDRMAATGDLAEALQIAAILRLLVHESRSNKPLLKQLTPSYLDLTILGTSPPGEPAPEPGKHATIVLWVPISFTFSEKGVRVNPQLSSNDKGLVTIGKWWVQPSLIIPGAVEGFSRSEIVLGLADKEGGVHVDPGVPQRFQQLLDCESLHLGPGYLCAPVDLARMMTAQSGIEMRDCLERNCFPTAQSG